MDERGKTRLTIKTWRKGFHKRRLFTIFSPQTFAMAVANVYDGGCKRLRERMQTFAVKRGSALQGRMQCTARADAVHCGDGCSALRLRWAKQTPKSPVLFWIREKGGKTRLYPSRKFLPSHDFGSADI